MYVIGLSPLLFILSLILKGPKNKRVLVSEKGNELELEFSSYFDYLLKCITYIPKTDFQLVGLENEKRGDCAPGFVSTYLIQEMTLLPGRSISTANNFYEKNRGAFFDFILLTKFICLSVFIKNFKEESDNYEILGVKFKNTSYPWVEDKIQEFVTLNEKKTTFFVNAHCLNVAHENQGYKKVLASADLVLPDGMGVLMASRMMGKRLRENINGTDLFPRLLRLGELKNYKVYFLGGTKEVNQKLIDFVQTNYKGVNVAGGHHGHFNKDSLTREIILEINKLEVDLLFVAFGVPCQELWIESNKNDINAKVILGVGGLFDFYSGKNKRSPSWLRELGLEWIYRIYQEPKRMWKRYVIGNPKFLYRVYKENKIKGGV